MVTVRKEERAGLIKGLLETTMKAMISRRILYMLTFGVAGVYFYGITTLASWSAAHHDATTQGIHNPGNVRMKPPHRHRRHHHHRVRPNFAILREELAIRQAQPVRPYTPSLAEIAAFKANIGDVCNAHNKYHKGYRFAQLADKHAIKEWVNSVTPQLHIAQEYAHVDASNITALTAEVLAQFPSPKFMIKAAHTSGCVASVSMEANTIECLKSPCFKNHQEDEEAPTITGIEAMVSTLQEVCQTYLDKDFSAMHNETQYENIPRRCVLEELLEFSASSTLFDYKVHTFHGRPAIIVIYGNRFGGRPTRNARTPYDWKEVPIAVKGHSPPLPDKELGPRPDFLDDMLRDTQTLAQRALELVGGFPYVRVDFFVYQKDEQAPHKANHSNSSQILASEAVVAGGNIHTNNGNNNATRQSSSSSQVAFSELTFTHTPIVGRS